MARKLSGRETAFIAGLAVLAAAWMWHSWTAEAPEAGGAVKKAEGKGGVAVAEAPVVHLDLLDRALVKYDATGRDLFRYQPRPPSWAEVKRLKAEAEKVRQSQIAMAKQEAIRLAEQAKRDAELAAYNAAHPPPPIPPPPPTPPVVTFQFIGYVGPANDRVAAFLQNQDTIIAKTGDVVAKDFKIQEIRYESVILAFTDPRFQGQSRELPLYRGSR
jgi:hypothetical protein